METLTWIILILVVVAVAGFILMKKKKGGNLPQGPTSQAPPTPGV
ncbi:MAG: FeoB-associated Cys-rich membrane protein [Minisyncoccales bacterium]